MNSETKEFIIQKLTELYIKQDIKDKQKGTYTYVKVSNCYKDLIKFFKEAM